MRYATIKKYDISNGSGIRTSFYCTGCTHHCCECFNRELWDFESGKEFDEKAKEQLFEYLSDEHCVGLSVLGGEPLQQGKDMLDLLTEIKEKFANKNIWLWTGYYLSELNDLQKDIINLCDYVVDGRFDCKKSGLNLRFRGSTNQTIWEKDNKSGKFVKSKLN